ncbi:uncharacterized protein ARMOST_11505 [Armillaria ostoyae]|uniref:Uncharacterized protein n=1 Tax=Armillaria ostoyae TaxID=47428 RepID=A0A284RHC3_ARMOS|nr:uncharacterized protein ARMOST_11505 [Armillaria ostoyae]
MNLCSPCTWDREILISSPFHGPNYVWVLITELNDAIRMVLTVPDLPSYVVVAILPMLSKATKGRGRFGAAGCNDINYVAVESHGSSAFKPFRFDSPSFHAPSEDSFQDYPGTEQVSSPMSIYSILDGPEFQPVIYPISVMVRPPLSDS